MKGNKDWHKLTQAQLAQVARCPLVRVQGGAGSMFLWDSRTVHSNAYATKPNMPRYVVYTCYQPRNRARAKDMATKSKAWNTYRLTSHWPSHTVTMFPAKPRDYGKPGEFTPLEGIRNRPNTLRVRQLAGVERMEPAHRTLATGLLALQPSDLADFIEHDRALACLAIDPRD